MLLGWAHMAVWISTAQRFDSRQNSVNALRLGLAAVVLFSHTLTFRGGSDPLGDLTGGVVDLGTVAVDGFFAVSGYLIARSYLHSPSLGRYLWRRCLRILPAFWVCLVVSAVVLLPVAQLIEYGTLAGFPLTGDQSVIGYVVNNSALFIQQFHVRGLMQSEAVDGSLYTLFYEFVCYLGVGVLGVLGILRRRRALVLAFACALWLVILLDLITGGSISDGGVVRELFMRLGSMFIAGVVLYLWSDRIPMNWWGGGVAGLLLVAALGGAALQGSDPASRLTYLLVAPAAVAYLVILIGSSRRLTRLGATRDLSYGVYIYAWPIQVILLLLGAAAWPLVVYLGSAAAITAIFALVSWIVVEAPALTLKSWSPRAPSRGAHRSTDVGDPARHSDR